MNNSKERQHHSKTETKQQAVSSTGQSNKQRRLALLHTSRANQASCNRAHKKTPSSIASTALLNQRSDLLAMFYAAAGLPITPEVPAVAPGPNAAGTGFVFCICGRVCPAADVMCGASEIGGGGGAGPGGGGTFPEDAAAAVMSSSCGSSLSASAAIFLFLRPNASSSEASARCMLPRISSEMSVLFACRLASRPECPSARALASASLALSCAVSISRYPRRRMASVSVMTVCGRTLRVAWSRE